MVTKSSVVVTKFFIDEVAHCQNCSWHSRDGLKGEPSGRRHTDETGHEVIVTLTHDKHITRKVS